MAIAALVTWILTALGGFYLLSVWLRRGGHRGNSSFPTWLPFTHFGIAAVGLLLWIWYVVTDNDVVGWVAFALLVPVAALGLTMAVRWFARRSSARSLVGGKPADQHFPAVTVGLHGLLAVVTVVLVLLSALEVGS